MRQLGGGDLAEVVDDGRPEERRSLHRFHPRGAPTHSRRSPQRNRAAAAAMLR